MSVKIIIVTADDKTHQIGGNWMTINDAAGDVNGGDFWSDVGDKFPAGVTIKEIRLVPDSPIDTPDGF